MEKKFTWIETHKQIVKYLNEKKNSQGDLISLLKSVGMTPFRDKKNPGEYDIELSEIDPFTFFCYIYKYGEQKKLSYLQEIAEKIHAPIPNDVKGIPSAQAQKVWLFPFKYLRKNNEISRLWSFFSKIIEDTVTEKDWTDILTIKNVGKTKLTEALFYINPEKYLPINGPTIPYLKEQLAVNPEYSSYAEYLAKLQEIKERTNDPFVEISYRAWKWSKNKRSTTMNNPIKYSEELLAFLKQSQTDNLKTKQYRRNYLGTSVTVGFGQGVSAKIPWISFLKKPFVTQDGIYPVYLFYKNINKLILAYGVSETNKPQQDWNLKNAVSIKDYFEENSYKKPYKYGSSYLYKIYDVNNLPGTTELNSDLDNIIEQYLQINTTPSSQKLRNSKSKVNILDFHKDSIVANLKYSKILVSRYISSLATKPFTILTGLSGSGKTKLAEAFSMWISEDEKQYCMIAVGADWTNREPLLGFPNALETGRYIKPDNDALDLIIRAKDNPNKPYFLILDEMNMSHVERYFADFLSAMESTNRTISLHPDDDDWKDCDAPATLTLPENLFIIGTVNIDETTYMFSPKVLDRANVIEFRVSKDEMKSYFDSVKELDMESLRGQGASMGESFVAKATEKNLMAENMQKDLMPFFDKLQDAGAEFGYRTASEISRFVKICTDLAGDAMSKDDVIDAAIMQKLLPKVHGSRNKIEKILKELGKLCLTEAEEDVFNDKLEGKNIKYKLSYEKLERMHKRVISDGFTSYAEA